MSASRESVTVHPGALAPGTQVGGWRVVERLGVGGYGAVYRVEDMAHPGDYYALKVALREDARAEREQALMMTRAAHPNVVRFLGCSRWPHPREGFHCFVMDLVRGAPLHQWAETEGVTFRGLAQVGAKVALALGALHRRGVRHRDLKPEHILIRESDGEPVLLDFGAGWFEGAAPITTGALPPATLHVLSPEAVRFLWRNHARPGAHYVSQPTDDLYSLGVCLYRAVTGRYPFSENLPLDIQQYVIVYQSPYTPREFNPRVPRGLDALIMRLLAKKPEARYPSGEEVHAALVEAAALGKPGQWDAGLFEWEEVAPEKPGEPPRRRPRKSKVPTRPVTPPAPRLVVPPPLPDAHQVARRGPKPLVAAPWEAPSTRERWMLQPGAIARAVVGALVLLLAAVGVRTLSSPEPTHEAPPRREVASRESSPEAGPVAAPRPVDSTAAPAAPRAASPQDTSPVKKPPKTHGSPEDVKQKAAKSGSRGVCAGLVGVALQACVHTQPPVPVVHPDPAPQACPTGTWENMEALGFFDPRGARQPRVVDFPIAKDSRPVEQGVSYIVTAHEGPTTVSLYARWGSLLGGSALVGELLLGEKRVYGRFTQARTPDGQMHAVCLELLDLDNHRGLELEPDSEGGTLRVFARGLVHPVRSFE